MRMLPLNRVILACGVITAFCVSLAGCASGELLRTDWISEDQKTEVEDCQDQSYGPLDKEATAAYGLEGDDKKHALDGIKKTIQTQLGDPKRGRCWRSAWENHGSFELFSTEFDDVGMATDLRKCSVRDDMLGPDSPCVRDSQLLRLYKRLDEFDCAKMEPPGDPCNKTPVNIVVFTHGWHGSASPYHWYTIGFRNMLNSIALLEKQRAERESDESGKKVAPRRVIGIEIAWRGDSIEHPEVLSVWDRKQAAETLSLGAVQGLLAHMHDYYQRNSCHIDNRNLMPGDLSRCGHANMLMLGHSYGALIDFRSLVGQLASGLRIDHPSQFAYSFGDLVILVNPAFEGIRYTPTFLDAQRRVSYPMPGVVENKTGQSQLPVLVTLQSEGDTATKFWFKAFRHVTTVFDNPQTAEEETANINAVGWVDEYVTHRLVLSHSTDKYDAMLPEERAYSCRARDWSQTGFTALNGDAVFLGKGMTIKRDPGNLSSSQGAAGDDASATMPPRTIPGFPLWSVRVEKQIMTDHDDIWNKYTNDIMLQLYWTVVLQNEKVTVDFRRQQAHLSTQPLNLCPES
ncbi:hypothetical protein P0D69_39990 [Paraburkholderia sediminicola]|uniref:hypothetical protein n=1 Tax=Paraburkholderia sediminicola TaxID=458836 RepID=UPI0038BC3458